MYINKWIIYIYISFVYFDWLSKGFFNGTTNTVNLQPQATSLGSEEPQKEPETVGPALAGLLGPVTKKREQEVEKDVQWIYDSNAY